MGCGFTLSAAPPSCLLVRKKHLQGARGAPSGQCPPRSQTNHPSKAPREGFCEGGVTRKCAEVPSRLQKDEAYVFCQRFPETFRSQNFLFTQKISKKVFTKDQKTIEKGQKAAISEEQNIMIFRGQANTDVLRIGFPKRSKIFKTNKALQFFKPRNPTIHFTRTQLCSPA